MKNEHAHAGWNENCSALPSNDRKLEDILKRVRGICDEIGLANEKVAASLNRITGQGINASPRESESESPCSGTIGEIEAQLNLLSSMVGKSFVLALELDRL